MLDAKFNFWIILVEFFLAIAGVLFWFSAGFAHGLEVIGFFSRLFAGIVCFALAIILHFIGTRG
jgi:hypothetical protein